MTSRVRVSADRADRVPLLGPLGGPEGVERGDDFRETGHGGKATCLAASPYGRAVTSRQPVARRVRAPVAPRPTPGGRRRSTACMSGSRRPAPASTPALVSSGESLLGHPYV